MRNRHSRGRCITRLRRHRCKPSTIGRTCGDAVKQMHTRSSVPFDGRGAAGQRIQLNDCTRSRNSWTMPWKRVRAQSTSSVVKPHQIRATGTPARDGADRCSGQRRGMDSGTLSRGLKFGDGSRLDEPDWHRTVRRWAASLIGFPGKTSRRVDVAERGHQRSRIPI